MKINSAIYHLAIMSLLIMSASSCKKKSIVDTEQQGTVRDIDGNVYHTIDIGTQTWMVENLKTTKYRNGDPIPNVTYNGTCWECLTTGAYCDYRNEVSTGDIYGHLYNWYAVDDVRNIAPKGWHVPSDAEWTTLTTFLDGEFVAGGKLKETKYEHWGFPNVGATNKTGFKALPGGARATSGGFDWLGQSGLWWSSTESSTGFSFYQEMGYLSDAFSKQITANYFGFSVRCIKD